MAVHLPVPNSPVLMLNAATATGVGDSIYPTQGIAGTPSVYSWQVNLTGSPATVAVNLEGTLDFVNWFPLDSTTNVSGDLRFVVNYVCPAIRANLITLTGGSSPTVSVLVMVSAY